MEGCDRNRRRLKDHFLIRSFAYPDDYAVVFHLWSTAGAGVRVGDSDTSDEIRKILERDPDLFLLAEAEGQIVGTVLGGFDGRRGLVYHLAVRQDYRNQGAASALMAELETRLRSKGCLKYYLLVTVENEEAIRFYEKHGCERMDLHIYGKKLV
jgi:ribosomal protein S18 acetylase RimI-like enzyme